MAVRSRSRGLLSGGVPVLAVLAGCCLMLILLAIRSHSIPHVFRCGVAEWIRDAESITIVRGENLAGAGIPMPSEFVSRSLAAIQERERDKLLQVLGEPRWIECSLPTFVFCNAADLKIECQKDEDTNVIWFSLKCNKLLLEERTFGKELTYELPLGMKSELEALLQSVEWKKIDEGAIRK